MHASTATVAGRCEFVRRPIELTMHTAVRRRQVRTHRPLDHELAVRAVRVPRRLLIGNAVGTTLAELRPLVRLLRSALRGHGLTPARTDPQALPPHPPAGDLG